MKAADIPVKFPVPFAESAGSLKRAIPDTSQIGITDGAASLPTGFVPLNDLPISSGGVPPAIQDMNGILFESTGWNRWTQAGAAVPWDSAFSAAIGGYPIGAVVASAVVAGVSWMSTVDDNTTDPDSGGAGWLGVSLTSLVTGQVYFLKASATVVDLSPRGGSTMVIDKVAYKLSGTISADRSDCYVNGAAHGGLLGDNIYDVFLFNPTPGTFALDFWLATSAPVHMTDTTPGNLGIEVRSDSGTPDSTRSYVGKVLTNTLGQFDDQGIGVLSWFNREKLMVHGLTGTGSLSSSSLTEIDASARLRFLTWKTVDALAFAAGSSSAANAVMGLAAALDGIAGNVSSIATPQAGFTFSNQIPNFGAKPEGQYTLSPYGSHSPGTFTVAGAFVALTNWG